MGVDALWVFPGFILLVVGFCMVAVAVADKNYGFVWLAALVASFGLAFVCIGMSAGIGSPKTDIGPGEYRIGFVQEAGNVVSLGVIKQDSQKVDHQVYHQLDRKIFDGAIPEKATKLIVVQIGSFKKLVLK